MLLYGEDYSCIKAFFYVITAALIVMGEVKQMKKLTIGMKISCGFIVMVGLIAILGVISLVSLKSFAHHLEAIDKANQRLVLAMQVENSFNLGVGATRGFVAYGDEKLFKQMEQTSSGTVVMEYQLIDLVSDDKRQETQKLINLTTKYGDGVLNDLAPVVRAYHKELAAGNAERAQELKVKAYDIAKRITPYTEEIASILQTTVRDNKDIAEGNLQLSYATMYKEMIFAGIVGILSAVIGIGLSIFLTRMICRPIRGMLVAANTYADGDLRAPVNLTSTDELGELALALNKMQNSFKNIISSILASAKQVSASSDTLAVIVDNSAKAATQVDNSINQVAGSTERQLTAVGSTSAVAQQMMAGVQQISTSVDSVVHSSHDMGKAAQDGLRTVETAIEQIRNIESTVVNSAEVVTKLNEYSQQIGQIVNTISSIASQTNLLALNAAIEAARAGEQGRGFAVVADEVRKLAEQAQQEAKQIAQLISEIQDGTAQAVTVMQTGTQEVKEGTTVVNTAGKVFEEISTHINEVTGQVQQISVAIKEIRVGSQQIVDTIDDFANISKSIAGQTQTVSAATQQQAASMQEITASGQSLAQMAKVLNDAVNKFKI